MVKHIYGLWFINSWLLIDNSYNKIYQHITKVSFLDPTGLVEFHYLWSMWLIIKHHQPWCLHGAATWIACTSLTEQVSLRMWMEHREFFEQRQGYIGWLLWLKRNIAQSVHGGCHKIDFPKYNQQKGLMLARWPGVIFTNHGSKP